MDCAVFEWGWANRLSPGRISLAVAPHVGPRCMLVLGLGLLYLASTRRQPDEQVQKKYACVVSFSVITAVRLGVPVLSE